MGKKDPLTLWRQKAARDARKAELSATYRATKPGKETPDAIAAMDELARMAVRRRQAS